jgi:hypothetical protein
MTTYRKEIERFDSEIDAFVPAGEPVWYDQEPAPLTADDAAPVWDEFISGKTYDGSLDTYRVSVWAVNGGRTDLIDSLIVRENWDADGFFGMDIEEGGWEPPNVEVCRAFDAGEPHVFIFLNKWAVNGDAVQSVQLTLAEARALAAELLDESWVNR